MKGVCQLLEPINHSNNLSRPSEDHPDRWMIMERAQKYSLKRFIERRNSPTIGVAEAIQLTLKLTAILREIQNRSVTHQNLSPENIMINWNSQNSSIDQAQLTVLNFSQTVMLPSRNLASTSSIRKWYKVAQANEPELKATVDASGICAVLFWLITKVNPRDDTNELPHQQERDKLNRLITMAVNEAGMH